MKKRFISIMICALLLCTALAGTAFAASVSGPSTSVKNGDTITVTISGEGSGTSGRISTSGLAFVSTDGEFCTERSFILLRSEGGLSATYTSTVSAAAGETVSVTISGVTQSNGERDEEIPGDTWSATVAASETPSTEPSPSTEPTPSEEPSPSGQPSAEPSGSATVNPSPGQTASSSKLPAATATVTAGKTDKLPKTGDASMDLWILAVAAAALGSIALIAGRKVFSHK